MSEFQLLFLSHHFINICMLGDDESSLTFLLVISYTGIYAIRKHKNVFCRTPKLHGIFLI